MTLTKEDFKNLEEKFATKDEFNKLTIEVISIKEELKTFVTKKEFNEKMDEVLTVLDGIAKTVGVNEAERTSNIVAHDRFEQRITRTEKELKLDPIYS